MLIGGALLGLNSMLKPSYFSSKTTFHPENLGTNTSANPLGIFLGANNLNSSNQFMIGVLESKFLSEAVASDSIDPTNFPTSLELSLLQDPEADTFPKVLMADLILKHNPSYTGLISYLISNGIEGAQQPSLRQKVLRASALIRKSMSYEIDENGFIELNISGSTDRLSGLTCWGYLNQLNAYYARIKTQKARRNLEFFTKRADKIEKELNVMTRTRASYQDRMVGSVYSYDNVYLQELLAKESILREMYISLVLSKEQAEAQLQEVVPAIQILDPPVPPFRAIRSSLVLNIAMGLILGMIVGTLVAVWRTLARDAMKAIRMFYRQAIESASNPQPDPADA